MYKGVLPIPYIIALILGVIAIGVFGYWLIAQQGRTTNIGATAECQAKVFSYCVQWQNNNCENNNRPQSLVGCANPDKSDCEKIDLCK